MNQHHTKKISISHLFPYWGYEPLTGSPCCTPRQLINQPRVIFIKSRERGLWDRAADSKRAYWEMITSSFPIFDGKHHLQQFALLGRRFASNNEVQRAIFVFSLFPRDRRSRFILFYYNCCVVPVLYVT